MSYVREVKLEKNRSMSPEDKKKASDLVEKARKEDSKLVSGIFKNHEAPGGDAIFSVRLYKGDPVRTYHLVDGETYELPLGVAKHINRQCKYKKHKWLVDKEGKPIMGSDKPIERYSFISTEYQ